VRRPDEPLEGKNISGEGGMGGIRPALCYIKTEKQCHVTLFKKQLRVNETTPRLCLKCNSNSDFLVFQPRQQDKTMGYSFLLIKHICLKE